MFIDAGSARLATRTRTRAARGRGLKAGLATKGPWDGLPRRLSSVLVPPSSSYWHTCWSQAIRRSTVLFRNRQPTNTATATRPAAIMCVVFVRPAGIRFPS